MLIFLQSRKTTKIRKIWVYKHLGQSTKVIENTQNG